VADVAHELSHDEWTSPTHRFSPFVALCAVGFLGRLSYEMMRTPLTPVYAKHLGAPDQYIGLLVAAVTIVGNFVKLPTGALSDVFGFRKLMIAGALVKASGPFVYLLALSWPVLLIVRFYHGLATAIYAPPASALVAKVYPKERGYRLGLYNGAANAGVVLGPVLGGALITLTASNFPMIFIVGGVIGILSLLAMLRVPEAGASKGSASSQAAGRPRLRKALRDLGVGVREIIADAQIRLVSMVEAMLWVGIGSAQAYLPLYALTIHLPAWQIGELAGAQGVASVWSRPIMGRRSDRLSSQAPDRCGFAALHWIVDRDPVRNRLLRSPRVERRLWPRHGHRHAIDDGDDRRPRHQGQLRIRNGRVWQSLGRRPCWWTGRFRVSPCRIRLSYILADHGARYGRRIGRLPSWNQP
jgi:MFS family permease